MPASGHQLSSIRLLQLLLKVSRNSREREKEGDHCSSRDQSIVTDKCAPSTTPPPAAAAAAAVHESPEIVTLPTLTGYYLAGNHRRIEREEIFAPLSQYLSLSLPMSMQMQMSDVEENPLVFNGFFLAQDEERTHTLLGRSWLKFFLFSVPVQSELVSCHFWRVTASLPAYLPTYLPACYCSEGATKYYNL